MQKHQFFQVAIMSASLGLGLISAMPNAHASNLIPQREGEIETTNLGCIVSTADCITSDQLGYQVTSLGYQVQTLNNRGQIQTRTYRPSRLFVDKGSTINDWGFGIRFQDRDAGTNPLKDEYWLRPVAYNDRGQLLEKGQLEVGRFLFDFGRTIANLTFDIFDIEDTLRTGTIKINGQTVNGLLAANGDNGMTTVTLKNVSTLELQLGHIGYDSVFRSGDGVRVAGLKAVPEPRAAIGFGLLATAATFGLKKRKRIA